ncbi:MAG: glycogen debranching protein GlgX [Pseudomonadota bacterium]
MKQFKTMRGSRYPMGARWKPQGTNFSVFTRHATGVDLALYEFAHSPEPFQVIQLDPSVNRTFFFWHVYVSGLPQGIHYTWRVDGPGDTAANGFRFDRRRELLDPWTKAVSSKLWNRKKACLPDQPNWPSMRSMIVEDSYDWEGDRPVNHAPENMIIYEIHIGGFTRHASSKVAHPGTFAGIIEKIPYLKNLGVTDVEFLPVMAFDEQDLPENADRGNLKNFWGYSTHSFFCPHPGYCVTPERGSHLNEFRDMVKALHTEGIGVILDVVYNHTAEGGASGPTINFKGFGNETSYHLDPTDKSVYRDYTGCGNTVNCNHPIVTAFILESLEFWVKKMHVDGFRFDLASVLARGEDGHPLQHAPLLWNIEFSFALEKTKVIAEAWDAAGLYQVGAFPGFRWADWNGCYRDVIRRFVRGDGGLIGQVATRISGSSDLYAKDGRKPVNGINFITCHDGFTLYDLVSYNEKHNEANGENNRDGSNDNFSWNCGFEGETNNPQITALRKRQARNFIAILLLSQGVPMLLAGDETLRTQKGNNNAYCQDNEFSWFDWTLLERNRETLLFVKKMISFRRRHPSLMRNRFLTGKKSPDMKFPDVSWHGSNLNDPKWDDNDSRVLGFTLAGLSNQEPDIHVMMNMSPEPIFIELPYGSEIEWFRVIDTANVSAYEDQSNNKTVSARNQHMVEEKSVVVYEARPLKI